MEHLNSIFNINLHRWNSHTSPNALKFEDFICDIHKHMSKNKEQILQEFLQHNEDTFMNEECLENYVREPDYIQFIKNNPSSTYPDVSEKTLELFTKANRIYRKYFKKNLDNDTWFHYLQKLHRGVAWNTLEKIWSFENPVSSFIPVFIIHKNVDIECLGLFEKIIPHTFYYCFNCKSSHYSEWLDDHYGCIQSSSSETSYDRRNECLSLFPYWEKAKWALIVDENVILNSSILYYMYHLLSSVNLSYLTYFSKNKDGSYYDNTQLICDTLPSNFSHLQPVTSAFGGFCFISSNELQTLQFDVDSFRSLCPKLSSNKFVLRLKS